MTKSTSGRVTLKRNRPGEFLKHSRVDKQNDLELDFKVFFFVDSCCVGTVLDKSN